MSSEKIQSARFDSLREGSEAEITAAFRRNRLLYQMRTIFITMALTSVIVCVITVLAFYFIMKTFIFNECIENSHACPENSMCVDTLKSYHCICDKGFQGDGLHCTDIDECNEHIHDCHSNATCVNHPGSYHCACNEGFYGNGSYCEGSEYLILIAGFAPMITPKLELITPVSYSCVLPSLPESRSNLMAIYANDSIIACGGEDTFGSSRRECWSLNLKTNSEWIEIEALPGSVSDAATSIYEDNIFLFGGYSYQHLSHSILKYSLYNNSWETIDSVMSSPRWGSCAITMENFLLITGGNPTGIEGKKVELTRFGNFSTWMRLPNLQEARDRHGCASINVNNEIKIIIAGGYESRSSVEINTLGGLMSNQKWTLFQTTLSRCCYPALFISGGKVLIGGGNRQVDHIEEFDLETNVLKSYPNTRMHEGRAYSAHVVVMSTEIKRCNV